MAKAQFLYVFRGGYYHAMYGAEIVDKYRERYKQRFPNHPMFKRKEPSFVEFVHFLIGKLNTHLFK